MQSLALWRLIQDKGHDAFLLDEPEFHLGLKKFITGQIKEIKL